MIPTQMKRKGSDAPRWTHCAARDPRPATPTHRRRTNPKLLAALTSHPPTHPPLPTLTYSRKSKSKELYHALQAEMSITKGHDEHGAPTVTFPMRPRTADAIGSARKGGRVRPRSALGVREIDADLLAQQATSELKMIKMKRTQQRAQPQGGEKDEESDDDEMPTIMRNMTEQERLKAEIKRQKQTIKQQVKSRRNTHWWNMAAHSAHTEAVQEKAASAFGQAGKQKQKQKKTGSRKLQRRASSSEMMASGSAVAAAEEEAARCAAEEEDMRVSSREEAMRQKAHETVVLHHSHHHADHHHITRMPTFSVKQTEDPGDDIGRARELYRRNSQEAARRQENEDEDDDGSASASASSPASKGSSNGGDGSVKAAWDETKANTEQNAGVTFVPDTPATPAHDSLDVRRQDTPSPFEHLILTPGQPAIVTSLRKDDESGARPDDTPSQLQPSANEYYLSPPSTPGDNTPAKKRVISFADPGMKAAADAETSPLDKYQFGRTASRVSESGEGGLSDEEDDRDADGDADGDNKSRESRGSGGSGSADGEGEGGGEGEGEGEGDGEDEGEGEGEGEGEKKKKRKKKTKEEKERDRENREKNSRKTRTYRKTITGGLITKSGGVKDLREAVSKQHDQAEEVEGKRRATMNMNMHGGRGGGILGGGILGGGILGGGAATGDGSGGILGGGGRGNKVRKTLVTTSADMPRVPLANNWREVADLSQEKKASSNFSHHETAVAILEATSILLDSGSWRDLRELALKNFTEFYADLKALDITDNDTDGLRIFSSTMATFKFQRVLSPSKDVPKCCRKIGAWLLVGLDAQRPTLNCQRSTFYALRSALHALHSTPDLYGLTKLLTNSNSETAGVGADRACEEWAELAFEREARLGSTEARRGRGGHHAQEPEPELERPAGRVCPDALTIDA